MPFWAFIDPITVHWLAFHQTRSLVLITRAYARPSFEMACTHLCRYECVSCDMCVWTLNIQQCCHKEIKNAGKVIKVLKPSEGVDCLIHSSSCLWASVLKRLSCIIGQLVSVEHFPCPHRFASYFSLCRFPALHLSFSSWFTSVKVHILRASVRRLSLLRYLLGASDKIEPQPWVSKACEVWRGGIQSSQRAGKELFGPWRTRTRFRWDKVTMLFLL